MTSMPRFSRNGRISHSSVSIDLVLTSVRAPRALRMSSTIWLCSAASLRPVHAARRCAIALRSNSSR